ncbi:hypothetical protein AVEN_205496-1 [Araneus ventricosus]|uniref:Uncharacterized protein n=1 Tax=Araneus ventricosus TaxID=182803 RepID=A0A4Y2LBN7_ARAVE|nr:hypothetical protein AVEN_205496-1 [Araneus ventricosus]
MVDSMLLGHPYHHVDTRRIAFRRAGCWSRCRANAVLRHVLGGAALWSPIVSPVPPFSQDGERRKMDIFFPGLVSRVFAPIGKDLSDMKDGSNACCATTIKEGSACTVQG